MISFLLKSEEKNEFLVEENGLISDINIFVLFYNINAVIKCNF